ncbi:alcohol dehydrogenase [compost metagenome]
MKASGIGVSDLQPLHDPKHSKSQTVVEGHEPCDVVEMIGSAASPIEVKIGDRFIVDHYDRCRTYQYLNSGWTPFYPPDRTVFDGRDSDSEHAEYMKVSSHTLIKLSNQLTFDAGTAIFCGSGKALDAIKDIGLCIDNIAAIYKQRPVGFSFTMAAKAFGARGIDLEPSHLAMTRKFGTGHIISSPEKEPFSAVRALTRNFEGADKPIECRYQNERCWR